MSGVARFARPFERVFACVVLVWLGGARGPWREELRWRAIPTALLVVSLGLLWRRRRELRGLLAASWPLLLPVLFAALSPLWSLSPQESLRAALVLEAATAFGLWLALRFDLSEQHALVAFVLALIVAGSALAALFAPSFGVMHAVHVGAWQGLLLHKNALARVLALAVLACGLLAWARPRTRVWAGATVVLALAMFAPTRSVGGLAALVLASIPVGLVAALRRLAAPARLRTACYVCVGLAVLGTLAFTSAGWWLPWLGRDITLTRRTEIWQLVIPAIGAHPWIGHGAGAFWHGSDASREISRTLRFDPGSAHNGFLDLALDLGVVGLVALAIPFALALVRAVRLALTTPGAGALWPLAFLSWFVTSNLAEGALLRRGPLSWAVFVATGATLALRANGRSPWKAR